MTKPLRKVAALLSYGALALGLAIGGPALAANPNQPGGKACMSDAQLRAFMTDVFLNSLNALAAVCTENVPAMSGDVEAARALFAKRAGEIATKAEAEVTEIFRPDYGDEAPKTRMAALEAAMQDATDFAKQNWNADYCSSYVERVNMVAGEINGPDLGPAINELIDGGFATERANVPRC